MKFLSSKKMFRFINLFLLVFSIYGPLVFFEVFLKIFRKEVDVNSLSRLKMEAKELITQQISLETKLKDIAFKNGYQPIYYPSITKKKAETYNVYPIGSLPYANNFFCNEGYGLIKYQSDRFGLRNDDAVWSAQALKNNKQTIFIGDSFVQGSCVEKNNTIDAHYSNLNSGNIINLGMAGNSPYEYLAAIKYIVKPILYYSNKPLDLIVTFYANDNHGYRNYSQKLLENSFDVVDINSMKKNTQIAITGVSCRHQIKDFSNQNPKHILEIIAENIIN